MEATVTPEAEQSITNIAARYGISRDAVLAMLFAVNNGGGTMAQFNIPELGGSGQWMSGGMTMVGNMFDNALKARVDGLCAELSQLLATTTVFPAPAPGATVGGFTANNWWPADLGVPSSTGSQNGTRYAIFPATRRLALEYNGVTRIFDTGDHQIGGVQQQQGGFAGTLSFTSQFGTFDTTSLPELTGQQVADTPVAAPAPEPYVDNSFTADNTFTQAPPPPPAPAPMATGPAHAAPSSGSDDIFAAIEQLAGLHQRGILSDDEFSAKKAELLGRL